VSAEPPAAARAADGDARQAKRDSEQDHGLSEVLLVRHAETEWSRSGRHTGRTDLPLTPTGRAVAVEIAGEFRHRRFELVLVSPLRRARETCELCGLGSVAQPLPALMEWDYGDYEGLTSPEIEAQRPGWSLWRDGCPKGESPADVAARADEAIALLSAVSGTAAIFAHGHVLRVLAARWLEAEPALGARLSLDTGTVSALGFEHSLRALKRWNGGG
jgi:broad specificity phosphatase PhoE